jgi:hypothetical protein
MADEIVPAKRKRGRPKAEGITVAQVAKAAHVSERMIYYARRLARSGQDDLVRRVENGELKMKAALREAGLIPPPASRLNKLVSAWNRCSDTERQIFLDMLSEA